MRSCCDGWSTRSLMVDQLSYFSFQPVLHDWYVLSCLYDGSYNRKEGFLRRFPTLYIGKIKCVEGIVKYIFFLPSIRTLACSRLLKMPTTLWRVITHTHTHTHTHTRMNLISAICLNNILECVCAILFV